ncbi:MAG: outer membrane lipid asymmetry maintenance protein MlaD [Gammaproteobacteria bacterium]|nr:outer membrane lipid asymmetry maintenance protein MlaD [Gammaproteobacteria bacterium]
MSGKKLEIMVGLFLLVGLASISYLAIMLGDLNFPGGNRYNVIAKFTSASGLREGAYVEAGGVRIGIVDSIDFSLDNYLAVVRLSIDNDVLIHEDAIASIRTAGIIGDKFVKITPGGMAYLEPGMQILETEPSINLEELISKYIFESND